MRSGITHNIVCGLAILAVFFLAGGRVAAQSAMGSQFKRGVFEVNVNGERLKDVLDDIAGSSRFIGTPIAYTVIGEIDNVTLTISCRERTLPLLLQRIVRAADCLMVQRENHFTIYGRNAETALQNRKVTYIHVLRALPVDSAMAYLSDFDVKATAVKENSAIALLGTLDDIRAATFFLEAIDVESPIVMIELLVVEYRHGSRFDWGIDITNGKQGRIGNVSLNAANLPNIGFKYNFLDTLDPSFTVNLSDLIQNNLARVITNPHIAVRNGETGIVELEEEKNVVLQDANTDAGIVSSTIKQLQAGVSLTVKPTITSDGLILLNVDGNLSVFIPSPTKEYNIDKNIVRTDVNVRDGQTLIIGGLIKREESKGQSAVPGLSKLPLVGRMFRRDSDKTDHFETVIYITPHIYPLKGYRELGARDDLKFWMREIEANDRDLEMFAK